VMDVTLAATITITQPTGAGYGFGYAATIAALQEDAASGAVYVLGSVQPRLDPYLPPTSPLFDPQTGAILSVATLAQVPPGSGAPQSALALGGAGLAWPVGMLFLGSSSGIVDLDGDGDMDVDDMDLFAGCMGGPDASSPPGCEPAIFTAADLDADGDVDLGDYAAFQQALDEP